MLSRLLLAFFATTTLLLSAQLPKDTVLLPNDIFVKLQKQKTGEGKITITQDNETHYLVNRYITINKLDSKIDGWRIQIYNSSGKEARDEANTVREKFLNKHPNLKAYMVYQPPYFKIRVGDFRSRQDAFEMYKEIIRAFPISYLVPDKINLPELEE